MKGKFFLVSFLLLGSWHLCCAQYKLYEDGMNKYKAKEYEASIQLFSDFLGKSLRDKKFDIDAFYYRALSYQKTDKFDKAIQDFEEALLLNHPNKGNIYWFMAKCYENLQQYPEAITRYDKALVELGSNNEAKAKLLLDRSHTYSKSGNQNLALDDLRRSYVYDPKNQSTKQEIDRLEKTVSPGTVSQGQTVKQEKVDLLAGEKRYALVIGNSNYPKKIGALRNPVNDATDMADELKKSNFNVDLLTDATYGQMRAALLKFKERIDAGDRDKTVALFYFAGHGLQHEDENYLVPIDAEVEYEDDIARYCFPTQRMVLANMERSNARMNIVILDACRNNPFPALNRSVEQGLGEMRRARGSFIAYATAPGSVASDGSGKNGLYTQELLKSMRKPGLTIEQVFKEVRANVLRQSGDKQNTWDSSNIVGEFYFKVN